MSQSGTQRTQERVGWWELAALIVANKLSMLTTYAPIVTAVPASRDAWISAWLAAAAALLFTWIPYRLLKRFPGQTVFAVNRRVLGPLFGGAISLAYAVLFFHAAAVAIRMFSEVFVVAMLPETPMWAVNVLIALLAWYGVNQGVEGVGRMADLVAPLIVLTVLLLTPLLWNRMDVTRLLPVFEYGPGPMLLQTLTPIAIFGEMAWTVLLFMPYLKRQGDVVKGVLAASLTNAFMVSLGAALLVATLGPDLIDRDLFPTISAIRMIRVAEFLTRVEWMMAALWMGAMYVKLAMLFIGMRDALKVGVGFPLRRGALTLLVALAAVVWAQYVFADTTEMMHSFRPERWLPPSLLLQAGLPLVTLAVAVVRGQQGAPTATGTANG